MPLLINVIITCIKDQQLSKENDIEFMQTNTTPDIEDPLVSDLDFLEDIEAY